MRHLVLLTLLAATPALAAGDVTGDGSVFAEIRAGIICASGESRREPAPDTRAGFIELLDGEITVGLDARRIPALPGLSFGVVARVADTAMPDTVTVVITHPPMGADGSVRETWQSQVFPGDVAANFFTFDVPEERVPGLWVMQAEQEGRVIYTARFEVMDPAAMPGFVDPCEGAPPIS
jgi:hypothetical protein